jgi:hypothetical protein
MRMAGMGNCIIKGHLDVYVYIYTYIYIYIWH